MHLTLLPEHVLHNVLARLPTPDLFALAHSSPHLTNTLASYLRHAHLQLDSLSKSLLITPHSTVGRHIRQLSLAVILHEAELLRLANVCPHLCAFSLNLTTSVSFETFSAFFSTLAPTLLQFRITFSAHISTNRVLDALKHCTNITSISLRSAPSFHSSHFAALLTAVGSHLRILKLDSCAGVDSAILQQIASKCPILQQFRVVASDHIDDDAVHAITLSPCAKTLTRLQITGCSQITDLAIVLIASSCSRLEYVDISQLYLTSYAVRAIAEGLGTTLQVLIMAESIGIDDQALYSIAQNCDSLVRLEMSALNSITDHGVAALFCPAARQHLEIETLIVDRCTSLSEASLLYICGICEWDFGYSESCDCCAFYQAPERRGNINEAQFLESGTLLKRSYVESEQVHANTTVAMRFLKKLSALGLSKVANSTWDYIEELRPDLELRHDRCEMSQSNSYDVVEMTKV